MLVLLYFGFWIAFTVFAVAMFRFGGRTECWVTGMLLAAAVLTPFAGGLLDSRWRSPQVGVLAVDLILLLALTLFALHSSRFWPMTVASFQLLAVATHPALWLDPTILPFGYAFMQGFWAYPIMIVVALGAWRRAGRGDESAVRAFRQAGRHPSRSRGHTGKTEELRR